MEQDKGPACLKHQQCITQFICTDFQQHFVCQKCVSQLKLKKGYNVFSFEEFNSKIPAFNQKLATVKNTKLMMRQINRVKETFNQRISGIQDKVKSYQINPIKYDQKQYQQINGQIHQSISNPLFLEYLMGKKSIEDLTKISSKVLIQNMTQLRKVQAQIKNLFDGIERSFTISTNFVFTFSPNNKNPALEINEQRFISKTSAQNDGHLHLGLLRQPFSVLNNKVNIRLNKIVQHKHIMLGVCLLDVVKASDFFRCRGIGQGIYGIFLNRKRQIKLSHHSNQLLCNSKAHEQSKQFYKFWIAAGSAQRQGMLCKGDVITIEVNYFEQKVRFTRNYKQNAFIQMPIDINKGPLYGFIGSSYQGDIFQIGNDK